MRVLTSSVLTHSSQASSVSTYNFSNLYTASPHTLIKEKLTKLIEHILTERAHFIWLVMKKAHLSYLNKLKDLECGHVRKFLTISIIFWTIYLLDLAQNCINKL